MTLAEDILKKLESGPKVVRDHPVIRELVDGGQIVLVDALSGPLAVKTGEKMAVLTRQYHLEQALKEILEELGPAGRRGELPITGIIRDIAEKALKVNP